MHHYAKRFTVYIIRHFVYIIYFLRGKCAVTINKTDCYFEN